MSDDAAKELQVALERAVGGDQRNDAMGCPPIVNADLLDAAADWVKNV